MIKKSIIIRDAETGKITQICDVRDLTVEKFHSFTEQAQANVAEIEKEKRAAKEEERSNDLQEKRKLQDQIDNLTKIICHLLGYEELEENEILVLLGKEDPEVAEEELIEVEEPFIEPLEEEPHEETSEQE